MKFYLLTHPRELKRPTNSGALVLDSLGGNEVSQIPWERNRPDGELLSLVEEGRAALVYHDPRVHERPPALDLDEIEHLILLDGTWQEARKIFNKSSYLKGMPRYVLNTESESLYNIRRNQRTGGLSTVECVIHLLRLKQETKKAEILFDDFQAFLKKMAGRAAFRSSGLSSRENQLPV